MPVQCFEETVPFSGDVELTESAEDMIPFITVKLVHRDLELQPDADGEMREIAVDAVMELDIRLYEEEEVELLSDLYALDREVIPETGTACFDTPGGPEPGADKDPGEDTAHRATEDPSGVPC